MGLHRMVHETVQFLILLISLGIPLHQKKRLCVEAGEGFAVRFKSGIFLALISCMQSRRRMTAAEMRIVN
jgi:hypothetical protein